MLCVINFDLWHSLPGWVQTLWGLAAIIVIIAWLKYGK